MGEYAERITAAEAGVTWGHTTTKTAITDNYNVTYKPGKLTITKTDEEFEISLEDDEYVYDAAEHNNAKTATSTAASGTTTYSYSFEEEGEYVDDLTSLKKVDAGEYTIYVKGENPNYENVATDERGKGIHGRDDHDQRPDRKQR